MGNSTEVEAALPWTRPALTAGNVGKLVVLLLLLHSVSSAAQIVYSIWFGPLRKYPGPKTWIAFPILKAIALSKGTVDFTTRDLHARHGDVVRIGPNELSFTTAQAWRDIYGHGHAELKKDLYPGVNPDPKPDIINSNPKDHFRFRRAMLPAFSNTALAGQEALIQSYVDLLLGRLDEVARSDAPTDLVRWYIFTTFDMIGDLAFGEQFDGLKEGKANEWIGIIEGLVKSFPPLVIALELPLVAPLVAVLLRPLIFQHRRKHDKMTTALTLKRLNSASMHGRGDFMDLITRARGKEHGLSTQELASNADLLIIAGSETTATLLSGVTYYLLRNPPMMAKAQAEVRGAFRSADDITFNEASAKLPYMLACLNEALRIFPPVPTAMVRKTSAGAPTSISGELIPPNTRVAVHQLASFHSKRHFHKAREFHPDRWLPEAQTNSQSPFYNDDRDLHRPFSYGPRDCIGKNLAFHEMRLILAKVLWTFDLELTPESAHWAENQGTYALWEKPPMMVKIHRRQTRT